MIQAEVMPLSTNAHLERLQVLCQLVEQLMALNATLHPWATSLSSLEQRSCDILPLKKESTESRAADELRPQVSSSLIQTLPERLTSMEQCLERVEQRLTTQERKLAESTVICSKLQQNLSNLLEVLQLKSASLVSGINHQESL